MSCSVFCHVRNFTYLSVAKINKQNSDMTWRRYKLNLRNSLLLEEYFRVMEQFDPHIVILYIRANRCCSLYNDIFDLRGWKTEEINGIEFELRLYPC